MLARGKATFSKSPLSGVSARDLYVHAKYTHIVSSRTKKKILIGEQLAKYAKSALI